VDELRAKSKAEQAMASKYSITFSSSAVAADHVELENSGQDKSPKVRLADVANEFPPARS
jgi:hypothetical protein